MAATSSGRHLGGSQNLFVNRKYRKENTLFVNVKDNSSVKPEEVIEFIHDNCGVGSLLACVPKSGNFYEITLEGRAPLQYLLEGIKIGQNTFECHEVVPSSIVVSFMHLPAYIEDAEIEMSLRSMGVELLSPINRRFYPGTTIADGTRYAKIKLPENMTSLPYTMKFQKEYYRCIHNGQLKVCSLCYASDHLFRACPKFVCFKCKGQGHYARTCKSVRCDDCGEWEHNCSCRMSEQGENESGDDENNEWEENSEEVNIENDDEVHKDEEAIEGETETPVDVLGTQAPVKLDQEKTEEKENQTQNEIPTEEKVTENKNSEIIDSEMRTSDRDKESSESEPDTEVMITGKKKRKKTKDKSKTKSKKNK